MIDNDPDQDLVAAALSSAPPPEVSPSFLARVNARIDERRTITGWLALADFRAWTLRLVPVAGAMAVLAVLWPGTVGDSSVATTSSSTSSSAAPQTFTPSSVNDWQQDVTGNALIEAALTGGTRVR
jgi:hypothetical protein